ncbi:serine hydrolase domain-containing protein [Sphingomonas sp. IW22]|uniref:serine hydrolase domain-containing protein n=1 Tax=Sphingomonas sp. IW22 TaxID=3242489 RepID=UPI003521328D
MPIFVTRQANVDSNAARRWRRGAVLAGALALSGAAPAQQVADAPATPYARAIAAGYKAAMLCSGMFNAGRTQAQVERDELAGIYPDYQPLIAALPATIDRAAGRVSVTFDDKLPPRVSTYTAGQGCRSEPIGSTPAAGTAVPPVRGADPRAWPMGDAGIAPRPSRALSATIDRAFAGDFGAQAKTLGVVILRDGRVAGERYGEEWGPFVSNRTWSVAKSIAGTLTGMAVMDGAVATDTPARIAAWGQPGDPRAAIKLDQLLRMASGLHSDHAGNRTDAIYFGGTAMDEQATGWPLEAAPGSRFRYANNDTLLAVRSLREAMGVAAYQRFPQTRLFDPLGMGHTVAEQDWRGNFILSSQVWSTARDLARLGQLWLDDGMWQGKRLLPEGWVRYMTTPAGPQPAKGPGYGATLWLFGPEQGLPQGSFAAQGNRGQYIMVVPSKRLVVVRRGEDGVGQGFDIAAFTRAVIDTE